MVGDVYQHPLGRTVTSTDNSWMTLLTQNTAPLHFDAHYASQTSWGRPLVNSTLTLALVTGQSVTDVSQNVFANLGWDEVRLPAPVFEGDTIYSESTVLETRESGSRDDVGIVQVRTTGFNQNGTVVISFVRTLMVFRRGHGSVGASPEGRSSRRDRPRRKADWRGARERKGAQLAVRPRRPPRSIREGRGFEGGRRDSRPRGWCGRRVAAAG